MAFCPRCAAPNLDSAAACGACGARIASSAILRGIEPRTNIVTPGLHSATMNPRRPPNAPPLRWQRFALPGFICAFFFWPAGLVLSIIAYNQVKARPHELKGGGFAVSGIMLSILAAVFTLLQIASSHSSGRAYY